MAHRSRALEPARRLVTWSFHQGSLSSLVVRNSGAATETSPIVVAHGLAGTPTVVTFGVNAAQP